MKQQTKSQILAEIAQIKLMERGKLSTYTVKNRAHPAGPYYKLQRWEQGKNHTQYVRPEQVPLLQAALGEHARFQQLIEQLAQLVILDTRQQLETLVTGVKKKTRPPTSCWPKTRKSSS
ncbi:MAG: DUF6788 family protein [Verrucomicrobiota bacterium]